MKNRISASTSALSTMLCRVISCSSPINPNGHCSQSVLAVLDRAPWWNRSCARTPHERLHRVPVRLWHHREHGQSARRGAEHNGELAPVERLAPAVLQQAHEDWR
jgi:hypothetical protein